eukprot:14343465-Heterocapsa_arctica.AAC.1
MVTAPAMGADVGAQEGALPSEPHLEHVAQGPQEELGGIHGAAPEGDPPSGHRQRLLGLGESAPSRAGPLSEGGLWGHGGRAGSSRR